MTTDAQALLAMRRTSGDWLDVPCPRCSSANRTTMVETGDHLHGFPGTFTVTRCNSCGLWYQNPQPADHLLDSLYPTDYRPHQPPPTGPPTLNPGTARYLKRRLGYAHLSNVRGGGWRSSRLLDPARRRLVASRLVPPYVAGGRLLELGCAAGHTLQTFRSLGWTNIVGIEVVPEAARQAQALGFDVRCGRIEDVLTEEEDGSYDIVYSTMVLEHIKDPLLVIREVARVLKPGGRFHFSTICRDSFDRRLFGPYWGGFDLPRHMFYPTKREIRAILATDFSNVRSICQADSNDLLRSASWRGGRLDRLILRAGEKGTLPIMHVMALLNQTSRVSFQCVRRG